MHKIYRRFIMKRIFALLLLVLLLIPFAASCVQPNNEDDDDNKEKPYGSLNFDEVIAEHKGEKVNILGASWSSSGGEPGFPWSQPELCVKDGDFGGNAGNFGKEINDAVLEREEYIKETYDIDLNWIYCGGASMLNRLTEAAKNKGTAAGDIYHIAMPHVYEAQEIVVQKALYAIGDKYINFDADYYNQDAAEAFTLAGNTFYVAGDMGILEKQASFVLYYNNAVAEQFGSAFPDLYAAALNGTWTIDTLFTLADQVSENLDKKDEYTDDDKYGLGTAQLATFFQYFGIYQVGKSKDVDNNETFTLALEDNRVETIIEKMLFCIDNEKSIRTKWTGNMNDAFTADRLLFYHEAFEKIFSFSNELKVGLLPFPKLTTEQDRYYVPFAQQGTVTCVPRATDDRAFSECMIEVLAMTGEEYLIPAYLKKIGNHLYAGYKEKSLKVVEEQIFPNVMYDLGYMYGRFNGDGEGLVTKSIQAACIANNKNEFSKYMMGTEKREAEDFLVNWTEAYNNYSE